MTSPIASVQVGSLGSISYSIDPLSTWTSVPLDAKSNYLLVIEKLESSAKCGQLHARDGFLREDSFSGDGKMLCDCPDTDSTPHLTKMNR